MTLVNTITYIWRRIPWIHLLFCILSSSPRQPFDRNLAPSSRRPSFLQKHARLQPKSSLWIFEKGPHPTTALPDHYSLIVSIQIPSHILTYGRRRPRPSTRAIGTMGCIYQRSPRRTRRKVSPNSRSAWWTNSPRAIRCNRSPWRATAAKDVESASTAIKGTCSSSLHKSRGDPALDSASSCQQDHLTFPTMAVQSPTTTEHGLCFSTLHEAAGNTWKRSNICMWCRCILAVRF